MTYPIPPSLTDEHATFVEPLSCAIRIVEISEAKKSDKILVFGGGALGILVGTVLATKGNSFRYVEPIPERRRQLNALFNTECLSPKKLVDSNQFERVDVAIDCSGNPKALAQAIIILNKAGVLVLAGLVRSGMIESAVDQITKKELTLKGAWLNPNTFTEAIDLTMNSRSLLDRLVTKTFPLLEIERAFECASQKRFNKVFVRP
jgi:threonine dehydrogenase-like Zn-dependent dehydrogenase